MTGFQNISVNLKKRHENNIRPDLGSDKNKGSKPQQTGNIGRFRAQMSRSLSVAHENNVDEMLDVDETMLLKLNFKRGFVSSTLQKHSTFKMHDCN